MLPILFIYSGSNVQKCASWQGYFTNQKLCCWIPLQSEHDWPSGSIWTTCSCHSLVSPINSYVCKLNVNKKDILGQFWDGGARLGLGSPVSVCLCVRPAVMQPSLERQTEHVQPLFRKGKPIGMTAPKTVSDGSEACGREGHFHVSQQQPPKLGVWVCLEHKIIGSLSCHSNGLCWFLLQEEKEKRIWGLRNLAEIFPVLIIILSPLHSQAHHPCLLAHTVHLQ